MNTQKIIALVDCDSFFVSCEQKRKPELKGKPVCVISNKEGCTISRSKEAKKLGVKMGEPLFLIKKNHPKAISIVADHEYYHQVSNEIMNILKDFSPFVEVYSIDEAFVDFTGLKKLYNCNYFKLGKILREKIYTKTDIPVSIGISSTKTLAKLASDKAKYRENGIYLIGKRKLEKELTNTRIEEIWGIGKKLTIKMKQAGILYAKELIKRSDNYLKQDFGIHGIEMKHELLGEIVSPVSNKTNVPKSIQNTKAFGIFTSDYNFIKNELLKHIHTSCSKLRRYNIKCLQIGIMLRTKDFKIHYAQKELIHPTDYEFEIAKISDKLLKQIYDPNTLYRSTGIILGKIGEQGIEQLSLYDDNSQKSKQEKLTKCLDKMEQKYGKNIIQTGFTKIKTKPEP